MCVVQEEIYSWSTCANTSPPPLKFPKHQELSLFIESSSVSTSDNVTGFTHP